MTHEPMPMHDDHALPMLDGEHGCCAPTADHGAARRGRTIVRSAPMAHRPRRRASHATRTTR